MPDTLRPLAPGERLSLAMMWHTAWHDAHDGVVPVDLVRLRTLDEFVDRAAAHQEDFRVIGPIGDPYGMSLTREDELDQLYLAKSMRGKGIAAKLLAEAEARIKGGGYRNAWLNCAVGNQRAARFFEKSGWHRTGTMTDSVETALGPYALTIWRFEKPL